MTSHGRHLQVLAEKRELLRNFNVLRSQLTAEKQHAAVLQVKAYLKCTGLPAFLHSDVHMPCCWDCGIDIMPWSVSAWRFCCEHLVHLVISLWCMLWNLHTSLLERKHPEDCYKLFKNCKSKCSICILPRRAGMCQVHDVVHIRVSFLRNVMELCSNLTAQLHAVAGDSCEDQEALSRQKKQMVTYACAI